MYTVIFQNVHKLSSLLPPSLTPCVVATPPAMKVSVKTLKGDQFDIHVAVSDTVIAVKKGIEDLQGKESFPCTQQLLIYKGRVLKDETTMEENNVTEDSFLVVMLTKTKATANAVGPASTTVLQPQMQPIPTPSTVPIAAASRSRRDATPVNAVIDATQRNAYEEAASNLVAGNIFDQAVDQILDIGGGSWDRESVVRAMRAAYNNPERAVDYLYNGIPTATEVMVPAPTVNLSAAATDSPEGENSFFDFPYEIPDHGPDAAPVNLFPERLSPTHGASPGALCILATNVQFQDLRRLVQAHPQLLQPILQELGKQNPRLLQLINDNEAEFLRLINQPESGDAEMNIGHDIAETMPQSINVTAEESAALGRLEALGFDRARVVEAFLACDRNEQLAANYLLEDHGDDVE